MQVKLRGNLKLRTYGLRRRVLTTHETSTWNISTAKASKLAEVTRKWFPLTYCVEEFANLKREATQCNRLRTNLAWLLFRSLCTAWNIIFAREI